MYSPRLSLAAAVALCLSGCDHSTDTDTSRPAQFGFQTSIANSLVDEGRTAYQVYCIGCHGENGDGNGEAAVFLSPKPRNFAGAKFRFSSTRSGQLPTDDDLKRTLRTGLRGSAMPSFALLPERSIDGLVAYIKTFSPKWRERESAAPIPFVSDPYRDTPDKTEAILRGEAVYHGFATCWTCHPSYVPPTRMNEYIMQFDSPAREGFRPDLTHAVGKLNDEGQLVYPPDFRRDFVRAGARAEDLYRSIAAGISGTAMPTWVDSIEVPGAKPGDPPMVSRTDLWAIAYYVQSLILQRPALLADNAIDVRNRPRAIYLHGGAPPIEQSNADDSAVTPSATQPADDTFQP